MLACCVCFPNMSNGAGAGTEARCPFCSNGACGWGLPSSRAARLSLFGAGLSVILGNDRAGLRAKLSYLLAAVSRGRGGDTGTVRSLSEAASAGGSTAVSAPLLPSLRDRRQQIRVEVLDTHCSAILTKKGNLAGFNVTGLGRLQGNDTLEHGHLVTLL